MPSRSYLFAPGHDRRLLVKVFSAGADAVVLDLEDAVPNSDKVAARSVVAEALDLRLGGTAGDAGVARSEGGTGEIWVRINRAEGREWREDLVAVVGPALTGVRLPKAESAEAVLRLDEALASAEEKAGLETGSVRLVLTIESARGVSRLAQLAACGTRVEGLTLGAADLIADLGAQPEAQGLATLYSASKMVVESAAAGLAPPVAPVWTRLEDDEGLKRSTRWHRNLGFFGRSAIHPRQLAIIHDVFTPTEEEIERATKILSAHQQAAVAGSSASTIEGGEFVDEAIVRQARAVLELAQRGGTDG